MWNLNIGLGIGMNNAALLGNALLDGSESDGTNVLTNPSAVVSSPNWIGINATINASVALAPDGGTNASSIIEDAAANSRHIIYQSYASGIGTFRFSVYIKSLTRRYVVIYTTDSAGTVNKVYAYFDTQTGTITGTGAGGTASYTSSQVQAAVNGFYKVTLVGDFGAGETGPVYWIIALSDVGTYGAPLQSDNPSYSGDGASGVYIWRPKLVDLP